MWSQLSSYVQMQCQKLDREESHGFSHMQRVSENGIILFTHPDNATFLSHLTKDELDQTWKLLLSATWLHDLEDHKFFFDDAVKEKLHSETIELLTNMFGTEFSDWVFLIIDRGSHSKQNKNRDVPEWFDVLPKLCQIACHFLRDADRLDAIGELGLWRHLEYTTKTYQTKHAELMPFQQMIDVANIFVPTVLMKLKDTHFITPVGITMAENFTIKLGEELNELSVMATLEEVNQRYTHLPIC